MSFSIASFDPTPAAGFKKTLVQRREQAWALSAMAADEANSQRPVRRILLKAFPKEFWARIEPALQGDAFVLFAKPLNLLIDFAEAGGVALNEPGQWQREEIFLRPSDYLMRQVNASYRNDPRYSPQKRQENRDYTIIHLAFATTSIPLDREAFSYLRPRLRPLAMSFLQQRNRHINNAVAGNYSGIAPSL